MEADLTTAIIHSASIAPDRVADWIEKVSRLGFPSIQKKVFKSHIALSRYLTEGYVDFALTYLLNQGQSQRQNTHEPRPLRDPEVDLRKRDLEIRDNLDFIDPTFWKGPFLFVLRHNEDEGLRLVHSLVNSAVQRWRTLIQLHGLYEEPRTPLPVVFQLNSDCCKMWGDELVYYWFRPHSSAPYPVTTALMALEYWMEEQIISGRDPSELFIKVLGFSECVAVAGICLGIALGQIGTSNNSQFLCAAMPFLTSPHIWRMDMRRYASDSTSIITGDFKDDPVLENAYIAREKSLQRTVNIRNLALICELAGDDIRLLFEKAVSSFPDNLPFLYEDEKKSESFVSDLRREMEISACSADRRNYVAEQLPDGRYSIGVKLPQKLQENTEPHTEEFSRLNEVFRLLNWANSTIKKGQADDAYSIAAALEIAQKWHQRTQEQNLEADDTWLAIERSFTEQQRADAIIAATVASLVVDFEEVEVNGHLDWCRRLIINATRSNYQGAFTDSSPERGLGALIEHHAGNDEVRHAILKLATSHNEETIKRIFMGLTNAWQVDPILCWNTLYLCLSANSKPRSEAALRFERGKTVEEKMRLHRIELDFEKHLAALNQGVIAQPLEANFDEFDIHWYLFEKALSIANLPLLDLATEVSGKNRLLHLADVLLRWIIAHDTPPHATRYASRIGNRFFMGWLAALSQSLTSQECEDHILGPLRNVYPKVPQLTTQFMSGFISGRLCDAESLSSETITQWKELCCGVLRELKLEGHYPTWENVTEDALSLMLFHEEGFYWLPEDWPHVPVFFDIIEEWIEQVGCHTYRYPYLTSMLKHFSSFRLPEPTLKWLCRCADLYAKDNKTQIDFYRDISDNGRQTAEILNHLWSTHEKQIRANSETRLCYTRLVEYLVGAGVPLAAHLQTQLETVG